MIFYRLNRITLEGTNAWTSVSDVGNTFDGIEFKLEDYLACEERLIQFLGAIRQDLEVTQMVVRRWKKYPHSSSNPVAIPSDLSVGKELASADIDAVIRSSLREDSWCFLVACNELWLTVGDDYNIHLAASRPLDQLITRARELGFNLKQANWLEDGMREQFEG